MTELYVTKRDNSLELLDIEKIHQVLFWACENLSNVSISDIEMKSKIQFYNKIKTSDIHATMVRAAADLISIDNPNYSIVASRLLNYSLRKSVHGQFEPSTIKELFDKNVDRGVYNDISDSYDDSEWKEFDNIVKHDRDFNIHYAGMMQYTGKYLQKNRKTNEIFETPQAASILLAANVFINYPKDTRMEYIKRLYDDLSLFNISLPTPIMSGVRSTSKQYSSCVLIDCDDSLDSINASSSAIVKYISQKSGIGLNAGKIRSEKSLIRNGDTVHTGVIPFLKLFESSVKSCSQGSIRNGSATVYLTIWHYDVHDLLVLKNNKGTEDNRVRKIDYSFQFNGYLLNRFINGEKITLMCPHDVPDLYDAFFADQDKFAELYEKYEKSSNVRKRKVDSKELIAGMFLLERFETSRIYFQFTDHTNTHSSFNVPITMSNLCCEVVLPTKPLNDLYDASGEIALCILGAINLGNIKKLSDMEACADILVRTLDELIDLQSYPLPAAERSTINRRSLGVGVINLAYYYAKNNVKYDESAFNLTNDTFEAFQYYLIQASVNLAKEKGACDYFNDTKYSKGLLPIDHYKKTIDELVGSDLKMDWESLRADVLKYGMRNSTLSAIAPCETSAQIGNATNGIEPIRSLVTSKGSKNSTAKQVVPDINKLKNKYDFAWEMKTNDGYIKLAGIMQKYIDQAISSNVYYNPTHYPDGKVPIEVLVKDFLNAYKYGQKSGYYSNTNDNRGESEDTGCESGACAI